MATERQCNKYGVCGYCLWRKARPDVNMAPLPKNGECGVKASTCGRLRPHPNSKIDVTSSGPYFESELKAAFPVVYRSKGRDKRFVGGGHT